jgi:hypothetical protein
MPPGGGQPLHPIQLCKSSNLPIMARWSKPLLHGRANLMLVIEEAIKDIFTKSL